MKLSRKEFLKGSNDPQTLDLLLGLAEKAFKTWQPIWSPFIAAPLLEEVTKILTPLDEINCKSYGGFIGAERTRVVFNRTFSAKEINQKDLPIVGLQIAGNFLFDKTTQKDFLADLERKGILYENIGDLWIVADQGAQLICTPEIGYSLNEQHSSIRTVKIKYQLLEVNQLRLPYQRTPKKMCTVEASIRLDAIASAGFGLSRSKIVTQLKEGKLRLNWIKTNSSSQPLKEGDQLQLEGKGKLKVINIEITRKERWKIELLRE